MLQVLEYDLVHLIYALSLSLPLSLPDILKLRDCTFREGVKLTFSFSKRFSARCRPERTVITIVK